MVIIAQLPKIIIIIIELGGGHGGFYGVQVTFDENHSKKEQFVSARLTAGRPRKAHEESGVTATGVYQGWSETHTDRRSTSRSAAWAATWYHPDMFPRGHTLFLYVRPTRSRWLKKSRLRGWSGRASLRPATTQELVCVERDFCPLLPPYVPSESDARKVSPGG